MYAIRSARASGTEISMNEYVPPGRSMRATRSASRSCCAGSNVFSPNEDTTASNESAGGTYSFIEISVPDARALRIAYMFYMKRVIPLVGRVLLGNPANYRLLGTYTEEFGDCAHFARCLERAGLEATFVRYFFGCATGVVGRKLEGSS